LTPEQYLEIERAAEHFAVMVFALIFGGALDLEILLRGQESLRLRGHG
jgi:hypothetical protein